MRACSLFCKTRQQCGIEISLLEVRRARDKHGVRALLPLSVCSERRDSWILHTSTSGASSSVESAFDDSHFTQSCFVYQRQLAWRMMFHLILKQELSTLKPLPQQDRIGSAALQNAGATSISRGATTKTIPRSHFMTKASNLQH